MSEALYYAPLDWLAAIVGQIVGTSLSPEIWAAVALALFKGRSARAIVGWAIAAATLVVLVRLLIIGLGPRTHYMIAASYGAVLLWSLVIHGVRTLFAHRVRRRTVP